MNAKILNEGNQIHNFILCIWEHFCHNILLRLRTCGSDFLTSYGPGSTQQEVTVPTVPVPVPQQWIKVQSAQSSHKDWRLMKRLHTRCGICDILVRIHYLDNYLFWYRKYHQTSLKSELAFFLNSTEHLTPAELQPTWTAAHSPGRTPPPFQHRSPALEYSLEGQNP